MCRLFGLSAAPQRVSACFWLLDAPDSLLEQSHRNPDGTGLAYFDVEQQPLLDKQPLPAFEDAAFRQEAKTIRSTTFVSHIRYATTGTRTVENTHPFAMKGRVMAHNGTLYDLPQLEERLGPYRDLVKGDTDSERYFALITQEIDAHAGDVGAGIAAAGRWIAENLPLVSINMLLATATDLWALRYPDQRTLYLLERSAGGPHGDRHLHLSKPHPA
jgi:predicted glutamine amidotransferase